MKPVHCPQIQCLNLSLTEYLPVVAAFVPLASTFQPFLCCHEGATLLAMKAPRCASARRLAITYRTNGRMVLNLEEPNHFQCRTAPAQIQAVVTRVQRPVVLDNFAYNGQGACLFAEMRGPRSLRFAVDAPANGYDRTANLGRLKH